jgi:ankyrin repeat protein
MGYFSVSRSCVRAFEAHSWVGRKTRFEILVCDSDGHAVDTANEPVVELRHEQGDGGDGDAPAPVALVALKSLGFYRVSFSPVRVGVLRVRVLIEEELLFDGCVAVRARAPTAADIDGARCVVRGDGVRSAVCGESAQFEVELRDGDGERLALLPESTHVDFIGLFMCQDCDDVDVDAVLRADGVLACTFLAPTSPGVRLLHLSIGEAAPIAQTPYSVAVAAADAVGRTSFLKPAFNSHPELGATAVAVLVACDRFGNCASCGGASVEVHAVCDDGRAKVECTATVEDLGDGEYRLSVLAEALGALRVSVLVHGEPVQRSPFELLVMKPAAPRAADADARTSSQMRADEFDDRAKRLSAAMAAARNKRMSAMLVGSNAEDEWRRSTAGNMALHDAALVGNLGAVKQLLDGSEPVDALNDDERTPLYLAAWSGQAHVAAWLLERGAAADRRTKQGYTPLFASADRDHVAVVELLLTAGKCDANALSNDGTSALYHAAAKGHARVCALLLRHGADANAGLPGGWRALHGAVFHTRLDSLRVLLDGGAPIDVNARQTESLKGYTPLHLALARQRPFDAAVDLLLARSDIAVDAKTSSGQTPLHMAAMWGHVGVCEKLLARGASLLAQNKKGRTPLDMAVKDQKTDAAAFLRSAMAKEGAIAVESLASPRRTAIRKALPPQSPGDQVQRDLEAAAAAKKALAKQSSSGSLV